MSRLGAIQTAVGVHVTAVFTAASETVTLGYDPIDVESLPRDQFPHALILFEEQEPERLAFKQERRHVGGFIGIAMIECEREDVDARIEAIRDSIFATPTLASTVDGITCEIGVTTSSPDGHIKYGTLDISTEEVF